MASDGRSLVLLSGGIDSAVCLALAARSGTVPHTLAFDYGQRSQIELEHAARIAEHYGSTLRVARLDLSLFGGSSLTQTGPAGDEDGEVVNFYVPGRNLIFLSYAVAAAEALGADVVYLGANRSDHHHADCRPEFVRSFAATAEVGLRRGAEGRPVQVRAPLLPMPKHHVLRSALGLGVPLELTWSCYGAGPDPCTTCPACVLRAECFALVGAPDPARCAA